MTKLMLIQIADFLMGNIDNIPNEVLEKILANPDLQDQDLLSAGQTCQRWSSICEDILKKRKAAEIKETWTMSLMRCWSKFSQTVTSLIETWSQPDRHVSTGYCFAKL